MSEMSDDELRAWIADLQTKREALVADARARAKALAKPQPQPRKKKEHEQWQVDMLKMLKGDAE